MIVPTGELGSLAGTVTMVSGGFDPLHPGHIAYFRAAADLGVPLLVNVSHDEWVGRKHAPLLTQAERMQVIDALDMVGTSMPRRGRPSRCSSALRPRYFAKGADWEGRLPEDELDVCSEHGIESSSWTPSWTRRRTCFAASGSGGAERGPQAWPLS